MQKVCSWMVIKLWLQGGIQPNSKGIDVRREKSDTCIFSNQASFLGKTDSLTNRLVAQGLGFFS